MRILFVALSDSVHTARWVNQLDGLSWDIHLFPSVDRGQAHLDLRNMTVHHSLYAKPVLPRHGSTNPAVRQRGLPIVFPHLSWLIAAGGRAMLARRWPDYRVWQLNRLIRRLRPDIVHSLEFQAAGYLVSRARKQFGGHFPPWIATNWGSDIYLFGRLAEHINRIKEVLATCDYYSCECQRDVHLAKQLGLRGEVLPVLPNTGGFDLSRVSRLRQAGPTSARRLILVKGYQHWAGRALVALRALALCARELQGYRIAVYLANGDVRIAAELLSQSVGIPVEVVPYCSHDDMLRLYGSARIYVGLSISDAISTSLLEAMVMGAFPIQSCTGCADEWIVDGESGLIVPAEDPEPVAAAIRRALADDALVDRAAEINARVAHERLDQAIITPQVQAMYEKVAARAHLSKAGRQR